MCIRDRGCTVCSSVAAVRMAGDLRQAVFNKIQTFSFVELDKFKTSSLITRLTNDVTQIQQIVMMSLRIAVRSPLMCLGSIVMAFRLSPRLSLVLLISLPILLGSAGTVSYTHLDVYKRQDLHCFRAERERLHQRRPGDRDCRAEV